MSEPGRRERRHAGQARHVLEAVARKVEAREERRGGGQLGDLAEAVPAGGDGGEERSHQ